MSILEQSERAAVVAEALRWLGTPYHHAARIRGAGVDCAMLLAEVYRAAGVVPAVAPEAYPPDWHLHRDIERYLGWVERHARPTEAPLPGDAVLFKVGRCFAHGAIVIDWPGIVEARLGLGVIISDALADQFLANRQRRFFTCWGA